MRRSLKASAFSFGSIFVLSIVTLGYQNCSQFSANLSPKQEFLAKNRIFSSTSILPPGSPQQVELPSTIEPSAPVSDAPASSAPIVNQPVAEEPKSSAPVSMDAPAAAPVAAPAPTVAPAAAGTNGSAVGVVTDPGSRVDLPMESMCSTGYTNINFGTGIENVAEELKAVFVEDYDANNIQASWGPPAQKFCEFTDPVIKANLKQNKILTLIDIKKHCPNLAAGTYRLAIVKASQNDNFHRNLVYREEPFNGSFVNVGMELDGYAPQRMMRITLTKNASNQFDASFPPLLWDGAGTRPMLLWAENRFFAGDPNCTYNVSPLLVQLRPAEGLARGLELTAQFQGVMFDILGLRSIPVPFTKHKISWLSKKSADDHYFIVLPDAQGNVTGIEQLFGDNTSGPDGKFAKNGYLALGKWDGRRANGSIDSSQKNGLIDSGDPVFSSLRFWRDENRNGVAEKSELHALASLGVSSIDLNYDKNYSERDRFGNEIKMKSIVRTSDGRMHVMYDVWFRLTQ